MASPCILFWQAELTGHLFLTTNRISAKGVRIAYLSPSDQLEKSNVCIKIC